MSELDLSYCLNVDQHLITTFARPDSFQNLLEIQKDGGNKYKRNQTVVFEDQNIGVITRDQTRMVAIYENSNPKLGKLIGESIINVEPKSRKRIPSYEVVTIKINVVPRKEFTRSLAKLLLLVNGVEFARHDVPHHKRHPMINMLQDVEKVPNSLNSKLKPDFYYEIECFEYIKHQILKTDDVGFANFLHNIRFITQLYPNRRGIYVNGFHPAEVQLDHEDMKQIKIETSKI